MVYFNTMRIKNFFIFLIFALTVFISSSRISSAQTMAKASESGQFVIANSSLKQDSLSLNQLRAIFSLRAKAWPDGSKITVVVYKDEHPVHRDFLVNTLKMLPHQLRRQWDRYIYSGIGQGPVVVETLDEMLTKINETPGAIGYVEGGVPNGQVITLSIR